MTFCKKLEKMVIKSFEKDCEMHLISDGWCSQQFIKSFQLKKITVFTQHPVVIFCYLFLISMVFICFSRNTWFTHWIVMMGATFSVGISHEILWKWLTSSRCEIKLTSCWARCVLWCISHQKSYTTLVCRSAHFCVVNIKQRWQKSFMSIDFCKNSSERLK